jgi:stage V sporulation protein D (sporulation-specific penicillin-binding protein)
MENKEEKFIQKLSLLFLVIVLLFGAIFIKHLFIGVINREAYIAEIGSQLDFGTILIKAERGEIVDRNNVPLALSKNAWELDINPSELSEEDKKIALSKIPKILEIAEEKFYSLLKNQSVYVRISTSLNDEQKNAIESLNIKNGVAITPTKKRIYPYNSLASNVIGFIGTDEKGLSGIEYKFDSYLRGIDGSLYFPSNSSKPLLPGYSTFAINPKKGNTVQLTIDINIQYLIEKNLIETIQETNAKSGVVIVMNPKTGEILGMASYPNFNPNNLAEINNNNVINRAIQINYESGSVLKPIIAAAALEEGTLHTDDDFYCKGYLSVMDRVLHCWQTHGEEHGLNEIMRNSCDVAFMEIGLDLGKTKLYSYFAKFGFGKTTDIELPGEEKGILSDIKNIGNVELATMSFGQGIAVTPIQLITAFSAIANGGIEMKPTIIKEITDYKNNVLYNSSATVKKVVISPKVANEIMDALKEVISDKGVPQAKIEGYAIAGKTGTAQKPSEDGGYSDTKLIYSFCGIVPADNPEVVILTIIEETEEPGYSLHIAAPLFQKIASSLIKYLRIPQQ